MESPLNHNDAPFHAPLFSQVQHITEEHQAFAPTISKANSDLHVCRLQTEGANALQVSLQLADKVAVHICNYC
jgi:hypothetical protein